jgi:parvulin-like peptidyl-prolyl isomerase
MVSFSAMSLEPAIIIDFLKREVLIKDVCQKILFQQIIAEEAQKREIRVTAEETQREADQQRLALHLESAAATHAWLQEQLITPEAWEAGIHDRLLRQKLAFSMFGGEVDRYFAEHQLDFERVSLYRITVPYEQLAQELFYEIEETEISFYEAAHLYDIDERRRLQCGYEGALHRWSLKPEIAAAVFGARDGVVLGPMKGEQGYDLLMVEEFIAPELTDELRQQINGQMFAEWLNSELNYLLHHSRT